MLGSERGRDATGCWSEKGTTWPSPRFSAPGAILASDPWCPRWKCQSQEGLRCRETKAQEGPWVQRDPAFSHLVPRSLGAGGLQLVLSVLWALLTAGLPGSGTRKDSQGSHFPPASFANVMVTRRMWMTSGFIFPLTDGETEARGGEVSSPAPRQPLSSFLRHLHQWLLSLCRPPWHCIPYHLLMRP